MAGKDRKVRRVLLCDVGKVVIDFDNEKALSALHRLLRVPTSRERVGSVSRGRHGLFESDEWAAYMRGEMLDDELHIYVRKQWGLPSSVSDAQIDRALSDVFTPIEGTYWILGKLCERGVKIVALSNAEPCRVRFLENQGFWEQFHHRVASCEVKLAKPDPRIFHAAFAKAGVGPEETMFVDDVPEYTAAAEALGILSHTFTTSERFQAFLLEAGYDIEGE